jgi:hypothetical protein
MKTTLLALLTLLACQAPLPAISPIMGGGGGGGDMLSTNNLSVVANAATSRSNLGANSATNLTTGTVPDARFPATLPAASGANLTALNGSQLTSGTIPDARYSTSGFPAATLVHKASDANAIAPVVLYAHAVTVLTAGTPADIATLTVPAGITRFRIAGGNSAATSNNQLVADTAAGTLAGASFTAFDAAAGGGNQLLAAASGPTAAGVAVGWACNSANAISTSSSIVIRQTANSANAGTVSFSIVVIPVP